METIQRDFEELKDFTNLEKNLKVEHDTYQMLESKLDDAKKLIAKYESELEKFLFLKEQNIETEENLNEYKKL